MIPSIEAINIEMCEALLVIMLNICKQKCFSQYLLSVAKFELMDYENLVVNSTYVNMVYSTCMLQIHRNKWEEGNIFILILCTWCMC